MGTAILGRQFIQVKITFIPIYKKKLSGNIGFAQFVADANLAFLVTFFLEIGWLVGFFALETLVMVYQL